MKETWKEIPGFKDYEVSSLGRIRTYKRCGHGRIMTQGVNSFGYMRIGLYDQNFKRRFFQVHRLVMLAFCGESTMTVNHKDGNKKNNNIDNLEYLSLSDNHKHAFRTGLKSNSGEQHPSSKVNGEDVVLIRKLFNEYGIKLKTIADLFNVTKSNIWCIVNNKSWRTV